MSAVSPIPYVAPWRTEFNRYSTQTLLGTGENSNIDVAWTVPATQWWRVITVFANGQTDSNVANRGVALGIGANGKTIYFAPITAMVTASTDFSVSFTPTAAATSVVTAGALYAAASMPDLLLPQNSRLIVQLINAQGTDAFTPGTCTAAIEVYTEDYQPGGSVALVPAPLLT